MHKNVEQKTPLAELYGMCDMIWCESYHRIDSGRRGQQSIEREDEMENERVRIRCDADGDGSDWCIIVC